jgi:phosphoribosylamine--glycine ligase
MKVLIIGGGGREHALAYKAAQSNKVDEIFVAPGNAGTGLEDKTKNIDIAADDINGLLAFAKQNHIDLTIVGPEAPLVAGIVDTFHAADMACFGPTQDCAQLEGSKDFCKRFLIKNNIPTAEYATFHDASSAIDYLQKQKFPIVIKADGLAAGKGVIIAQDLAQAEAAVHDMLEANRFGEAGAKVVIEEFLEGEEVSFIVMADGEHVLPLATSQDHKARDNGDQGPNTGGMGAYSPAPIVDQALHDRIMSEVIMPTIQGMKDRGTPYTGFLYAGLMISKDGTPKVLEYNCRFGDPETQPILMRLQSDLVDLCTSALQGKLDSQKAQWDKRPALGVVMAAGGYPDSYKKGDEIDGLDLVESDVKVFHAGTQLQDDKVTTSGGRVLCVTALGDSVADAQTHAYDNVKRINWQNVYYRTDIGHRAINRNS